MLLFAVALLGMPILNSLRVYRRAEFLLDSYSISRSGKRSNCVAGVDAPAMAAVAATPEHDDVKVAVGSAAAPPQKSEWKDGADALREVSDELRHLGWLKYGFQPLELSQLLSVPKARGSPHRAGVLSSTLRLPAAQKVAVDNLTNI